MHVYIYEYSLHRYSHSLCFRISCDANFSALYNISRSIVSWLDWSISFCCNNHYNTTKLSHQIISCMRINKLANWSVVGPIINGWFVSLNGNFAPSKFIPRPINKTGIALSTEVIARFACEIRVYTATESKCMRKRPRVKCTIDRPIFPTCHIKTAKSRLYNLPVGLATPLRFLRELRACAECAVSFGFYSRFRYWGRRHRVRLYLLSIGWGFDDQYDFCCSTATQSFMFNFCRK